MLSKNPKWYQCLGDILENKVSGYLTMGKKCPQKIVNFYFCLKHLKMTTADMGDEIVSALVLNSMCFSPKIKIALLFPEFPFFQNCPFIFQKCFFVSQKCLFVCLSNGFFPRWLYFLLVLLGAAQRVDNCLALKTSTWSMISYAFCSSFILHDSLKMQFLRI